MRKRTEDNKRTHMGRIKTDETVTKSPATSPRTETAAFSHCLTLGRNTVQ